MSKMEKQVGEIHAALHESLEGVITITIEQEDNKITAHADVNTKILAERLYLRGVGI